MSQPAHDEIYQDMTGAFLGECKRPLTPRAEQGLRDFILKAVIEGADARPGSYAFYREYLMCRFKHIARTINQRCAESEPVKWKELTGTGDAETDRDDRQDCIILIPEGHRRRGLRICEDYPTGRLEEPRHLPDTL